MPRFWNAYQCGHRVGVDPLLGNEAHLEPKFFETTDPDTPYCNDCCANGAAVADLNTSMDDLIMHGRPVHDLAGDMGQLKLRSNVAGKGQQWDQSRHFEARAAPSQHRYACHAFNIMNLPSLAELRRNHLDLRRTVPLMDMPLGNQTVPYDVPYRACLLLPGGLEAFLKASKNVKPPVCDSNTLLTAEGGKAECLRLIAAGACYESEDNRTRDQEGHAGYWAFWASESVRLGLSGDEFSTLMSSRMKHAWYSHKRS